MHELVKMTWQEVQSALEETKTLLLPVGATEQHGHHLPIGVDTFTTIGVSERVAQEESCILAPPLWYSVTPWHMFKPGTISVDSAPYQEMIEGIGASVREWGIENFVIVNGHYMGTDNELNIVLRNLRSDHDLRAFNIPLHLVFKDAAQRVRSTDVQGHGSEFETSMMLHLHPELVDMDKAASVDVPKGDVWNGDPAEEVPLMNPGLYNTSKVHAAFTKDMMEATTDVGIEGDATVASREKGEALVQEAVDNIVELVQYLDGNI